MILTAQATVLGVGVTMTVEIVGDPYAIGEPREEAIGRIAAVMRREAQRFAEIAGVDVRDQVIDVEEAVRIRNAPANRSQIIAGVGSKDRDSVVITRGSVEVSGELRHAGEGS